MERTFVLIKPDGIKRNLIGEILKRYESKGLRIVDLKMLKPKKDLVKKHYPDTLAESLGRKSAKAGEKVKSYKEMGKDVLRWLRNFLYSSKAVAIIFEGRNAVSLTREITGYTDPSQAKKGTIRGDLGIDSILQANKEGRPVYNLVHASETKEDAKREIALWF